MPPVVPSKQDPVESGANNAPEKSPSATPSAVPSKQDGAGVGQGTGWAGGRGRAPETNILIFLSFGWDFLGRVLGPGRAGA